jgi:hypothetical protein
VQFLQRVCKTATSLKHLTIPPSPSSEEASTLIHFTQLHSLTVSCGVSQASHDYLNSIKNLVALKVNAGIFLQDVSSTFSLPCLEKLQVKGRYTERILRTISTGNLRTIKVRVKDTSLRAAQEIIDTMCKKFGESLRSVDIELHLPPKAWREDAHSVVKRMLNPLLLLWDLKCVTLDIDHPQFIIRDDKIHDMASSWSMLEKLTLLTRDSGPSRACLSSLASLCPNLSHLCIHLVMAKIVPSEIAEIPSRHGLQSLCIHNVGMSYQGDYRRLIKDLDFLFPRLHVGRIQEWRVGKWYVVAGWTGTRAPVMGGWKFDCPLIGRERFMMSGLR